MIRLQQRKHGFLSWIHTCCVCICVCPHLQLRNNGSDLACVCFLEKHADQRINALCSCCCIAARDRPQCCQQPAKLSALVIVTRIEAWRTWGHLVHHHQHDDDDDDSFVYSLLHHHAASQCPCNSLAEFPYVVLTLESHSSLEPVRAESMSNQPRTLYLSFANTHTTHTHSS